MSVIYFPLSYVINIDTFEPSQAAVKNIRPETYVNKSPSECCGALYTGNKKTEDNKGIVMWYSDEPEDAEEEDYFINSIKLVNGQYLHIKHNLCDNEPEPEEDEEW